MTVLLVVVDTVHGVFFLGPVDQREQAVLLSTSSRSLPLDRPQTGIYPLHF